MTDPLSQESSPASPQPRGESGCSNLARLTLKVGEGQVVYNLPEREVSSEEKEAIEHTAKRVHELMRHSTELRPTLDEGKYPSGVMVAPENGWRSYRAMFPVGLGRTANVVGVPKSTALNPGLYGVRRIHEQFHYAFPAATEDQVIEKTKAFVREQIERLTKSCNPEDRTLARQLAEALPVGNSVTERA